MDSVGYKYVNVHKLLVIVLRVAIGGSGRWRELTFLYKAKWTSTSRTQTISVLGPSELISYISLSQPAVLMCVSLTPHRLTFLCAVLSSLFFIIKDDTHEYRGFTFTLPSTQLIGHSYVPDWSIHNEIMCQHLTIDYDLRAA